MRDRTSLVVATHPRLERAVRALVPSFGRASVAAASAIETSLSRLALVEDVLVDGTASPTLIGRTSVEEARDGSSRVWHRLAL